MQVRVAVGCFRIAGWRALYRRSVTTLEHHSRTGADITYIVCEYFVWPAQQPIVESPQRQIFRKKLHASKRYDPQSILYESRQESP